MDVIWVGIGGMIGASARYLIGREITERASGAFPWGTFSINVIGALLIGVLFVLLTERGIGHEQMRLLLVVGLLGGFTTFSSRLAPTHRLFASTVRSFFSTWSWFTTASGLFASASWLFFAFAGCSVTSCCVTASATFDTEHTIQKIKAERWAADSATDHKGHH